MLVVSGSYQNYQNQAVSNQGVTVTLLMQVTEGGALYSEAGVFKKLSLAGLAKLSRQRYG